MKSNIRFSIILILGYVTAKFGSPANDIAMEAVLSNIQTPGHPDNRFGLVNDHIYEIEAGREKVFGIKDIKQLLSNMQLTLAGLDNKDPSRDELQKHITLFQEFERNHANIHNEVNGVLNELSTLSNKNVKSAL